MKQSLSSNIVPAVVRRALRSLRSRIRLCVVSEGIAIVVTALALLFWLGLWLDWLLEPSVRVRMAAFVVVGSGLAWIVYRYLVRPLVVPLSDNSLALLLERYHPQLEDHVATAVSVASDPQSTREYHVELVDRTASLAAAAMGSISSGRILNLRPLFRATAVALVLTVSIALFAVFSQESFSFWLQRIALDSQRWPRSVHLEVVGFEPDDLGNRVVKMARHDDFQFTARANITGEWTAPDRVEVRYRTRDGRRGKDYLTRVGDAVPGRDEYQTYRYTFKRVRDDLRFDLIGGDDRIRDLRLKVVDRPELVRLELDCIYPDYLTRQPQTLTVTSGQRIPIGSLLMIRAVANKPLASVYARSEQGGFDYSREMTDERTREVPIEYGQLLEDDTLFISLRDADGIESREPYRVALSVIPDELPQLAVSLSGIGSAVTPQAQIPVAGQITDDYGLQEVGFSFSVDSGDLGWQPFSSQPTRLTKWDSSEIFDLRQRRAREEATWRTLEPGQQLALAVVATDRCDLGDSAREGRSQRFLLDVVTPSDLLQLLERRELTLRQRFEATIEKLTDTRALLARIEFVETSAASADQSPSEERSAQPSSDEEAMLRALSLRKLRIAGARQNAAQCGDEVLGTAAGFDDIHLQLINNRIENEELRSRLKQQIATPLRHIGENRLPELEAELTQVEEQIESSDEGRMALNSAIKTTDAVLIEMRYVLERMLELETYNEVVAMLRGIISDQADLNEQTKQRRQQSLRSLLED